MPPVLAYAAAHAADGVRISSLSFGRTGMVLLDAVEGGFLPYPWKLLPRDLPHHLGECRPARANTQPDQPSIGKGTMGGR